MALPAAAQPAAPADEDRQRVEACLAAVATADGEPRACIGIVADRCLELRQSGEGPSIGECMERETAVWLERLDRATTTLATRLDGIGAERFRAIQEQWSAYRDARCAFGPHLYPTDEQAEAWNATCLLEETGRRAVEIGLIASETEQR